MNSFANERTLDYFLAPMLARRLGEYHHKVVPFFFWITREGSKLSKGSTAVSHLRVVAVFSRRPKLSGIDQRVVEIKFNSELFDFSQRAGKYGIVVLSGFPRVTSLFDLSADGDTPCSWCRIERTSTVLDRFLRVEVAQVNDTTIEFPVGLSGPLEYSEISQLVVSETSQRTWPEWIEILHDLKSESTEGHYDRSSFGRFSRYHPFYLALIN